MTPSSSPPRAPARDLPAPWRDRLDRRGLARPLGLRGVREAATEVCTATPSTATTVPRRPPEGGPRDDDGRRCVAIDFSVPERLSAGGRFRIGVGRAAGGAVDEVVDAVEEPDDKRATDAIAAL